MNKKCFLTNCSIFLRCLKVLVMRQGWIRRPYQLKNECEWRFLVRKTLYSANNPYFSKEDLYHYFKNVMDSLEIKLIRSDPKYTYTNRPYRLKKECKWKFLIRETLYKAHNRPKMSRNDIFDHFLVLFDLMENKLATVDPMYDCLTSLRTISSCSNFFLKK